MRFPLLLVALVLIGLPACSKVKVINLYPETMQEKKAFIKLPTSIELLKVNDEKVSNYFAYISGRSYEVHLPEGKHTIEIRLHIYRQKRNNDDLERHISPSIILQLDLMGQKTYWVSNKELKSLDEVEAFEKDPEFWVKEENTATDIAKKVTKHIVKELDDNSVTTIDTAKEKGASDTNKGNLDKSSIFNFTWAKATQVEKNSFLSWAKGDQKETIKKDGALKILQELWSSSSQEERVEFLLLTR